MGATDTYAQLMGSSEQAYKPIKKVEEDATFCLIKDGTFCPLFCLTNTALDV
jgi:hypothetical protein